MPFAMIGDIAPFTGHPLAISPPGPPTPPPPGSTRPASPIYSSIRNYKISENQSPRPQDRVFFEFNYYNNVNDSINNREGSPITQMKSYIYNFGLEKTFNNGMGSIGIRVPLENLTANSFDNSVSTPTSTALGNLTVFAKYILAQNTSTGSLILACWAITPPNATGRFAGAPYLLPINGVYFQPCIGYIYRYNKWYLQGFSGFSFSMNPNDVSFIYNDIGIGYFLIQKQDPDAWLTAFAPTFELHVNDPVNHRDPYNRFDPAGTADSVNLTFGLNFGIRNTAVLTTALVTSVASPKPFDSEAVVMLNIFFGRTRRMVAISRRRCDHSWLKIPPHGPPIVESIRSPLTGNGCSTFAFELVEGRHPGPRSMYHNGCFGVMDGFRSLRRWRGPRAGTRLEVAEIDDLATKLVRDGKGIRAVNGCASISGAS